MMAHDELQFNPKSCGCCVVDGALDREPKCQEFNPWGGIHKATKPKLNQKFRLLITKKKLLDMRTSK